jgi:polyadenylate-binding protein
VPGMRPTGAPMPNFVVPMVQQGQQAPRPGGGRRGPSAGGPVQQPQQSMSLVRQQVLLMCILLWLIVG